MTKKSHMATHSIYRVRGFPLLQGYKLWTTYAYSLQATHSQLREMAVREMKDHAFYFGEFVTAFPLYMKEMAENAYGDHLTLQESCLYIID